MLAANIQKTGNYTYLCRDFNSICEMDMTRIIREARLTDVAEIMKVITPRFNKI